MPAKRPKRQRWIVVRNWEKFQHYRDRRPPWIKNYLELLHDDAYLGLSGHRRAVLHGIWLEYASSRRRLPDDTSMISRRLGLRVTRPDLITLNRAGFLDFLLAPRYQVASVPRARGEEVLRTSQEGASARARKSGSRTRPSENGPPVVCDECGVGGGLHAIDCSAATAANLRGGAAP